MVGDIVLRACPCFKRLDAEFLKGELVTLERKNQLDGSGAGGGGGGGSRRNTPHVKDETSAAKRFFATCHACFRADADGTGESSGSSKSAKQAKAGSGRAKAATAAAATLTKAFPSRFVCMTCGQPMCDRHARDHYHEHKPAATGKGKKSRATAVHSIFLDLKLSSDHQAVCYCNHCDLPCGALASGLCWQGGGDANGGDEDYDYEYGSGGGGGGDHVEGIPVDGQGYALFDDNEFNEKAMQIARMIADAAGGSFPDIAEKPDRDGGKGGKKNKKHSGETPEEREARQRLKLSKIRELTQASLMGLTNMGNTCFFNATLQCLMRLSRLVLPMRAIGADETSRRALPGPLSSAFAAFAHKYGNYELAKTAMTLQPAGLFGCLSRINPMFGEYGQQDAQELYSCIVNGVSDEFELKGVRMASPMLQVLGGTLLTSVRCHECGTKTEKRQPFFEISVPLAKSSGGSGPLRIEECVVDAFQPEVLTGDNAFACEKCCAAQFEAMRRREEMEHEQRLAAIRAAAAAAGAASAVEDRVIDSSDDDDDDEEPQEDRVGDGAGAGADAGGERAAALRTTPPPPALAPTERPATPPPQPPPPAPASPPATRIRGVPAGSPIPPPRTDESSPPPAPARVSTPPPQFATPKKFVDATLSTAVERLSHCVVLHIKRFRLNLVRFAWEKDDRPIAFETTIDFGLLSTGSPDFVPNPAAAPAVPPPAPPVSAPSPPPAAAPKPAPKPSPHLPMLQEIFPDTPEYVISAVLRDCKDDINLALDLLQAGIEVPPPPSAAAAAAAVAAAPPAPPAVAPPLAATSSTVYNLVGIVEHRGTVNGGHYVAFVVDSPTGDWFLCNDGTVTKVPLAEVRRAQPYLLFYENSATAEPRGVRRV